MPTNAEEIAKLTDTGKTIVHRGRKFTVLTPPADENRADSPYVLRSPRGVYYALTRNVPNPHMLFGVGLYGKMQVLPGWFSDKSGELVSCK